jgi:hypothetical protein
LSIPISAISALASANFRLDDLAAVLLPGILLQDVVDHPLGKIRERRLKGNQPRGELEFIVHVGPGRPRSQHPRQHRRHPDPLACFHGRIHLPQNWMPAR